MTLAVVPDLDDIAADIRVAWDRTRADQVAAWEGYFAVGTLLLAARRRLPSNQAFGHWCEAQGFAIDRHWRARLMRLAAEENRARALLESGLSNGLLPGVDRIVALLRESPPVPEDAPIESNEWKALEAAMAAIRELGRDAPSVAAAVPKRRRAATARRLRSLGTHLGTIAWHLEQQDGTDG